jgi:hypothetical protein
VIFIPLSSGGRRPSTLPQSAVDGTINRRPDWFEVKEGEASIFKPDGTGKYTLVGRADRSLDDGQVSERTTAASGGPEAWRDGRRWAERA